MSRVRKQILLKRVTESQAFRMLVILAILYITLGMHLLHPALHCHSAHDHTISGRRIDCLSSADEQIESRFCPICDFLATKPFHQSGSALSIETYGPLFSSVSLIPSFTVKICSIPSEPRAPPS
jgi:hypothetical protein